MELPHRKIFEEDEVRRYLVEATSSSDTFLTVAAAVSDKSEAFAYALYLPREVYDSGAQVLVRQESYAMVSMLAGDSGNTEYRMYKNLKPFGMTGNAYDKASNRYCAQFIPVKQRSLGIKPGEPLTARQINLAARIEHNRWVTEKLLVGFRAPTEEEAANISTDKKREYYKARLIHEDLKAYDALGEDDKNIDVRVYDINISKALPYMLREYQGMGHC